MWRAHVERPCARQAHPYAAHRTIGTARASTATSTSVISLRLRLRGGHRGGLDETALLHDAGAAEALLVAAVHALAAVRRPAGAHASMARARGRPDAGVRPSCATRLLGTATRLGGGRWRGVGVGGREAPREHLNEVDEPGVQGERRRWMGEITGEITGEIIGEITGEIAHLGEIEEARGVVAGKVDLHSTHTHTHAQHTQYTPATVRRDASRTQRGEGGQAGREGATDLKLRALLVASLDRSDRAIIIRGSAMGEDESGECNGGHAHAHADERLGWFAHGGAAPAAVPLAPSLASIVHVALALPLPLPMATRTGAVIRRCDGGPVGEGGHGLIGRVRADHWVRRKAAVLQILVH